VTPTPRFLGLLAIGLVPATLAVWAPLLGYAALAYDGVIILLFALERAFAPRAGQITVARVIPGKICVGIENTITIEIASFLPARLELEIVDGWPAEFTVKEERSTVTLQPYEQKSLTLKIVPSARGEFTLSPVHVRVRRGLGLLVRALEFGEPVPVRVYPNLKELRRYELLSRRRLLRQQGFRAVRRVGEGREFERLREYSPDDDFRSIDWKATARRRRPTTRLYETERGQNVIVALDAGRLMGAASGAMTKLDHAINAALMLGYVAGRSHDRVGFVVFASEVERVFLPRSGRASMARMMDTLVGLQPRSTFSSYHALVDAIAQRVRRRSLIVLFTDLADPQAAREVVQFVPRLRQRHLPVCVAFRDPLLAKLASDPPGEGGMYEHVAALELHREWKNTLGSLRAGGVGIVDTLPEHAAVAAVNKYLEMKKRQVI
jgi:uncharacterized protein (DUF58 family)